MDVEPASISLEFLLIMILVLFNAFFAASEMAVVSVNKSRITYLANEGSKKAQLLLKLLNEPSKFLATIQSGITISGFLASASAATSISKSLSKFLQKLNIPCSSQISLILVTILISYITLVLGELLPKRIALQNSEKIALAVSKPILITLKITFPFVKVLTISTNILMRICGINPKKMEEKVSEEEIRMMIDVGQENGVVNQTEKSMIDGVFELNDTIAREVMTPRPDVVVLNINCSINDIIKMVSEEKFSRIPVYDGNIDNIIGILHMKDLFIYIYNKKLTHDIIKNILRPAYFVPETKNIDVLFKELQSTKNHMAILIDEYGGFSGIATIEDLIEEIVGDIFDEYDDAANEDIKLVEPNCYIVNGLAPIDEVNETLNSSIPSDNCDTIGGFVINMLGSIPMEGKEYKLVYNNLSFEVKKVSEKRIKRLKIRVD